MAWLTSFIDGRTGLEKVCLGIYFAIAAIVFLIFLILLIKGATTGDEGAIAPIMAIAAVFWPFLVPHWIREFRKWYAGTSAPSLKQSAACAPAVGSGALPPPASSRGASGGSQVARVVTTSPGQRCERCGSVIAAHDSPRTWNKGAMCGKCAVDLGVA